MSLWVDKYRPRTLDELDYHEEIKNLLRCMIQGGDMPHLLFHGPSGAGKRTRVMATLRELYGSSLDKIKIDVKTFESASGKKLDINMMSSMYHVEINPSDVGFYDRLVVQEIIKEIGQTQQIRSDAAREYKIVILNEADSLTRDAQQALRRTMEKYMSNLRIILIVNNLGKIIEPLQSRCLLIRVPCPTSTQMQDVMQNIIGKEGLQVPHTLLTQIIEYSEGNLRKALLCLETMKSKKYPFENKGSYTLERHDWEEAIDALSQYIIAEQSPSRLLSAREKLYELLSHCIPPTLILKQLTKCLLNQMDADPTLQRNIMKEAAFYEHRLCLGTKAIFHIEAFIAKFMSIYKRHLLSLAM